MKKTNKSGGDIFSDTPHKKRKKLTSTQVIALGFLSAIIIGTILLMLPISSADNTFTPVIDALFTAATSVCVTGLVVVDTYAHWSFFGQAVILILIQFGGLGIVTFTTSIIVLIGRKVTLKDRMLLEDAFNLSSLTGLVKFLRRVVKGTFIVETIGAICYSFVYIPDYGFAKGLWVSVFNAVSAFCNAGIDIIGNASLSPYALNPWINFVTITLIIMGGIGFIVWWDVARVVKLYRNGEFARREIVKKFRLHTKIAIVTTSILVFGGALLIFALEYNNMETIGKFNIGQKLMVSLFQSVTTRTAGFLTISQKGLNDATAFICIILMFIGGSPVGTAGGIKTTTIATLFLTARSAVKGEEEVKVYRRSISVQTVRKALSVVLVSLFVLIAQTVLLSSVMKGENFMDTFFEVASALGTAGLSRDYTAGLNFVGKIIIIICMFAGRIGPISMAIAIRFKGANRGMITYPEENITVG